MVMISLSIIGLISHGVLSGHSVTVTVTVTAKLLLEKAAEFVLFKDFKAMDK
jgi:hypothetical protein